ncbi:MAG: IS1 family transposase [Opitutaceae bacterium]
MNRLSQIKQDLLVAAIVEGTSIRGAARIADITKNSAIRNLNWIGAACQTYHDKHVRNLKCFHIEADEMWSYIHAKDRNLPLDLIGSKEHGDMWNWIGIDAESKLVISWHVGKKETSDAKTFATDLASRLPGKVQISTDQLMHYRPAFEEAFGTRAAYGTISKKFGNVKMSPDGKYEQPKLKKMRQYAVMGNPIPDAISTHCIERYNLSVRQSTRRFSRATLAFSRKIKNKRAAVALYFTYFNFCRIHPVIRVTPAMDAGLADHPWEIREIVALVADVTK